MFLTEILPAYDPMRMMAKKTRSELARIYGGMEKNLKYLNRTYALGNLLAKIFGIYSAVLSVRFHKFLDFTFVSHPSAYALLKIAYIKNIPQTTNKDKGLKKSIHQKFTELQTQLKK
jgi:hypothetical protein